MSDRPHNRKSLVIVRAGDQSLHPGWIEGSHRDFDLLVSYYGTTPDLYKDQADHYEMRRGPKWSCIADLLAERPELLDRYQSFWFPDDDIFATTDTLNRMFALFHGFELALAQPALTPDSYHSWPFLLQRSEYVLRFSNFVEVMVPIFDRAALQACLPTFSESRSGWGLDWLWPRRCPRPEAIAIIDATPVRHTRPVGGNLYSNNPTLDPREDERRLVEQYGLTPFKGTGKYSPCTAAVAHVRVPWMERLGTSLRRLNAQRRQKRRGGA